MLGRHMDASPLNRLWLALALLGALAITFVVYRPGLDADLYLDSVKIYQVEQLYREKGDDVELGDLSFGSSFGRVLPQQSFYLDIVRNDGVDPATMRVVNVLLHVVNAALVFWLVSALLDLTVYRDRRIPLALVVAFVWLLSATNASSVLYVVQRMNQLCALFSLLTMILYVRVRGAAALSTYAKLSILVPGLLVLGALAALSKENALLIPVFLLLIEAYLFPDARRWLQNRQVMAIVAVAAIAFVATAIWLAAAIGMLDFDGRRFTMTERILTETRVLWHYIGQLLLPVSSATGLYQDGFPVSRGLFSPLTTLSSAVGMLALVVVALRFWQHEAFGPVAFGIAFFLVGHSLESTIFPLEIYYEHRNYLPSVGLYLALVVLASMLLADFRLRQQLAIAALYLVFMAFMTHAKALTWSSPEAAYDLALERDYISPRAAGQRAQLYLVEGDFVSALVLLDRISEQLPDEALRARLQTLYVHCAGGLPPQPELYARLPKVTGAELEIEISQALSNIAAIHASSQCAAVDVDRLVPILKSISTSLRAESRSSWHIDYYIGRFYGNTDPQQAADWYGECFRNGEESAGYVLREMLSNDESLVISDDLQAAIDELEDD